MKLFKLVKVKTGKKKNKTKQKNQMVRKAVAFRSLAERWKTKCISQTPLQLSSAHDLASPLPPPTPAAAPGSDLRAKARPGPASVFGPMGRGVGSRGPQG